MTRKNFTRAATLALLPPLLAGYIRLVRATTRWRRIGQDHHSALIGSGAPFICAFWHSRLMMMPVLRAEQGRPMTALVSPHKDGEVLARVNALFGVDAARGSAADPRKPGKKKHGAEALKALVKSSRQGSNTCVTPDGPRGPRQRAQAGVIQLARLSGAPVLPMAYAVRRGWQAKSWDRFLLPFPFTSGVYVFGEPMVFDGRGGEALEAGRIALEKELNRITAIADEAVGRQTTEPAPTADEVTA